MSKMKIRQINPEDTHTRVPKTSHRAGPYKMRSLRGLGLVTLLLSHSEEWETSTEAIARDWDEGRDAVRTAIREVEEVGYLVRRREQDANGFWEVVYYVSADPAALAEVRAAAAEAAEAAAARRAAKQQVKPTTDFQALDFQSTVNQAVIPCLRSSNEVLPPTPEINSPSEPVGQEGGEDPTSQDPDEALTDLALSMRPATAPKWNRKALLGVIRKAQALGHPRMLVEDVVTTTALDPTTRSPQRLLADGFPGWDEAIERTRLAERRERERVAAAERRAERAASEGQGVPSPKAQEAIQRIREQLAARKDMAA